MFISNTTTEGYSNDRYSKNLKISSTINVGTLREKRLEYSGCELNSREIITVRSSAILLSIMLLGSFNAEPGNAASTSDSKGTAQPAAKAAYPTSGPVKVQLWGKATTPGSEESLVAPRTGSSTSSSVSAVGSSVSAVGSSVSSASRLGAKPTTAQVKQKAASDPIDPDKAWQQTLKDGVDALDTNRYWLAEPLLKKAVIDAGQFGIEDLRMAKSLGELARLYSVRGQFEDAEPLLEEELHIKQQTLDEEGEQLIPAMGSLIKFYLNHGTKSKADPLSIQMLEIVEGKLREPKSKPKTNVSKVDGKIVLEAWAGMASAAVRDPFVEWAIACDSVANVYFAQKNFELAERLYKAALEVKETVYGKTHLSLANSYDSLGGLALARNDFFTAESHLKDAYEMSSKILGKTNPTVYGRLDKLAKCLILAGKRSEAEKLYLSAQNIWPEPSKSGDDIRACYSLGNLYCEDKNYSAAEPLLKKAMIAAEEHYGECSESLAPYIQRYAYVLYYLGRKPESDELNARAKGITSGDFIVENPKSTL